MLDIADLIARDKLLYFLRIAIIICGYIVVRPLIEACFRRVMPPQETAGKTQKPTQKRLADELLVDSEDEADDVHTDSAGKGEWGGTMRKRQKAKFVEAWEQEQARLAEEEELRELEDILED